MLTNRLYILNPELITLNKFIKIQKNFFIYSIKYKKMQKNK